MKTERELFKATLIGIGYHESAFSFDSQTGMYALEMTQENWCIWQASAQREGYKLVPTEATEIMTNDGCDSISYGRTNEENVKRIYKAMIGVIE